MSETTTDDVKRAHGRYAAARRWGTDDEQDAALRELVRARLASQIEQARQHLTPEDRVALAAALRRPLLPRALAAPLLGGPMHGQTIAVDRVPPARLGLPGENPVRVATLDLAGPVGPAPRVLIYRRETIMLAARGGGQDRETVVVYVYEGEQ